MNSRWSNQLSIRKKEAEVIRNFIGNYTFMYNTHGPIPARKDFSYARNF